MKVLFSNTEIMTPHFHRTTEWVPISFQWIVQLPRVRADKKEDINEIHNSTSTYTFSRLECLCRRCFIEYFGFLPIDTNQRNFPAHSVKAGSQHFGLRCDVTGSPHKMIWTHVALHRRNRTFSILALPVCVYMHYLPAVGKKYCQPGFSHHGVMMRSTS